MSVEDEQLQKRRLYDMHEGLVFVIELTDTLLLPDPINGSCHLQVILEAIQESMSHSIITLPNTGYGVYLFNSSRTTEGFKTGIERLFELQDLNAKDMKIIPDILEESTLKDEDNDERPFIPLDERFKPATKAASENPLDDVLRVVQDDFLTKKEFQKLYTNKKIFLFTDNDEPIEKSNSIQKNILRNTCINLSDGFINIYPFFISTEQKPFNDKLYSELMLTSVNSNSEEDENFSIFDGPNTKPIDAKLIKEQILRRKEIRRRQLETTLELSEGLVIGIRGYAIYSHEKVTGYKYLYETASYRKNAYSNRRLVSEKTGEEFEKTTRAYKTGSGIDDIIQLNEQQEKEIEKYDEEKSTFLRLLGFKDEKSGIKLHYNVTTSTFIIPDEESISGSTRTLTALFKSLTKLSKVAILFGKTRKGSQPRYFALQPSTRPFAEGFFLIRLPFLDDIRRFPEGFDGQILSESTSDQQLKKITKLILLQLRLKNGYKPSEYRNPTLQQHYRVLHDYLLQVEQDPNQDKGDKLQKDDDTLRKVHQVRELVEASQLDESTSRIFKFIKEWNRLHRKA